MAQSESMTNNLKKRKDFEQEREYQLQLVEIEENTFWDESAY